jgi:hypothetical protein
MKKSTTLISVLLLAALVARLIYIGFACDRHSYVFPDTADYYQAADAIAGGNFFLLTDGKTETVFAREPLWPLVLSPFAKFFPQDYLQVRIFITLLLVLSAYFFIDLLRQFVEEPFAVLGGLLYLFYPFYFYFSGIIIQEPLMTVLLVVLVWSMLKYTATRERRYYWTLSGVILLLYYLRVTCIGLVPLLALPIYVERASKAAFRTSLSGAFGFTLLLLPWGFRNYVEFGNFSLLTRMGRVGLPGNEAVGGIDIQNGGLLKGALDSFSTIPGNLLDYCSPSINNLLSTELVSPVLNAISIIAVTPLLLAALVGLRRIFEMRVFLLYVALLLYSAPYLLLFGQTRYRLPADFIMIAFLVMLMQDVFSAISKKALFRVREA